MRFLKAINHFALRIPNATVQLDQRARTVLSFLVLSSAFAAFLSLFLHFGLVIDASELMPIIESSAAPEVLVNVGVATLVLPSLFLCLHYLLLLSFVKSLRAAIRRFLRRQQPPSVVPCSAPRSAHGSRAPPFTA